MGTWQWQWSRSCKYTLMSTYLTSTMLCVGYIDETIHHLAHLLDLRSGAVNWIA